MFPQLHDDVQARCDGIHCIPLPLTRQLPRVPPHTLRNVQEIHENRFRGILIAPLEGLGIVSVAPPLRGHAV
jgi:hypothetical protein